MDWSALELVVFGDDGEARVLVCLPTDNVLHPLRVTRSGAGFVLSNNPLRGRVTWTVRRRESSRLPAPIAQGASAPTMAEPDRRWEYPVRPEQY
jgi:hypothetical protein